MREENQFEILTFDVKGVVEDATLRRGLARSLGLPTDSSSSWEKLVENLTLLPREKFYFILYNGSWLDENDPELDNKLRAFVKKLARRNEVLGVMTDVLEDDEAVELQGAFLFKRRPFQFGLRGDDHLWRELGEHFRKHPLPKNESEFTRQLLDAIAFLAGQSVEAGKDFFVERYNSGGMSSGYVNSDFWINTGIPLLIGRFRMIANSR